jgi:hypothetical protein
MEVPGFVQYTDGCLVLENTFSIKHILQMIDATIILHNMLIAFGGKEHEG